MGKRNQNRLAGFEDNQVIVILNLIKDTLVPEIHICFVDNDEAVYIFDKLDYIFPFNTKRSRIAWIGEDYSFDILIVAVINNFRNINLK